MKQLSLAPTQQLRRWFWILLVLNLLFIIGIGYYLRPLTSGQIVSFELARYPADAQQITTQWANAGLTGKAQQSIYFDFLFILLYTSGLAVACIFIARLTGHEILVRCGKFLTYLLVIAGICDVIENLSLLSTLRGTISDWHITLAYDMATTKFSLLMLALLFIAVCLVYWILGKLVRRRW